MATTTNYSWTTPDDTALVKDGAAAIRSLGTAIDTTVFNNASAAIVKTIVDAKGDIIAATAADTVARLAYSGTNGDLLTVDTSTATGLKWATPAAAGGMTLISETVASALTSLSFTSLGSYKQLLLIWTGIQHSATGSLYSIRFNSNSSSVYNFLGFYFNQSPAFTGGSQAQLNGNPFGENATGAGNNSCSGELLIDNYTSSSKLKGVFYKFSYQNRNAPGDAGNYHQYNSYFDSTTAITSIDIFRISGAQTFSNITNHTIRLYGIA
jgi:hypothetical protein